MPSSQTIREKNQGKQPNGTQTPTATPAKETPRTPESLIPENPLGFTDETPLQEVKHSTPRELFIINAFNTTEDKLSPNVKLILSRLDEYESKMNAKVTIHSEKEGAENQLYLINTLLRALNYKDDDMFTSVDLILWTINTNRRGTFSDGMVYRFIPYIKRSAEDVLAYTRILEIFIKLSDPSTRAATAKSPMMARAVQYIPQTYKQATYSLAVFMSRF